MKTVKGFPPNYDYLVEHFPALLKQPVAITYGDTLYVTNNGVITDHLLEHEEIHSADQLAYPGGPDAYIERYITDIPFRLEAEIKAYIVQLRYIKKKYGTNAALISLPTFAKHLSSTLYGSSISSADAANRLRAYLKRK